MFTESVDGWGPAAVPGPRAVLRPSPRRAGRGEETQPGPAEAGANPYAAYPGRHCPQDPAGPG